MKMSIFVKSNNKLKLTMTIYNKLFNAFTYSVYSIMIRSTKGKSVIKWETKFINLVNVLVLFLFAAIYGSIAYKYLEFVQPKMKYFVTLFGILYVMIIALINRPIRRNLKRNNPVKRYTREQKKVA